MTTMMDWNAEYNRYEAPYDDEGKQLFCVDGDWLMENLHEDIERALQKKHPSLSLDEICELKASGSEEADAIWDEAKQELLDPEAWLLGGDVIEIDHEGNRLNDV